MTDASNAGLSAFSFDPALCAAGSALTAGTIYLSEVWYETGGSLLPASVYAAVGTAGGGSSAASFMGVYNVQPISNVESQNVAGGTPIVAGTRLAVTANIPALAVGFLPQALTWLSGFGELPTGLYWIATVVNETTTQPTIAQGTGGGNVALPNLNLAAASMRAAVNGTGATSLPANLTVASNTATGARPLCVGLSL
jgi:hypothetical protein